MGGDLQDLGCLSGGLFVEKYNLLGDIGTTKSHFRQKKESFNLPVALQPSAVQVDDL